MANRKELSPQQRIIANLLLLNLEDNNNKRNLSFYENLFVSGAKGTEATRLKKLFEFIYSHATNFSNIELENDIEFAKNFNELF